MYTVNKIDYKSLEKPLNMLFKVEIAEKTAFKDEYTFKLFDLDILPDKTSFWSGHQHIQIIRKQSLIDALPGNDVDLFVQQISAALHQLTLKIGFNGMPVSVEKQSELWQKWLAIRENMTNSYTGDWIDSTLIAVDKKMLPGEALTEHIKQDLFLNEYFRGIYDARFVENNFSRKREVYGLCPFPIRFNEKWVLQTSENQKLIKFSGNCTKNIEQPGFNSWLKTKTNKDITEISAKGFYQINPIIGWCNALESTYSLIANNSYIKTLKITLTTN